MPRLDVVRTSRVDVTPRLLQIGSMFDVEVDGVSSERWQVDVNLDRPWSVGLIVGPSGCGKSTLARELFGDQVIEGFDWPESRAMIDGFADGVPIDEIVGSLTSVGFSSPPHWLRPFAVLSNGEKFRATMARALVEAKQAEGRVVVIDEFTSLVDRQVARVASHAVQKTARRLGTQFVAVTCHHDIVDWLDPDWILEPGQGPPQWRSLRRRPTVPCEIYRVDRSAWASLSKYHYLSHDLHKGAACFGAYVEGRLVAFAAMLHFPHHSSKVIKRVHRIVVHPDWQGLGIGGVLLDWLGEFYAARRLRLRIITAHPGLVARLHRSPRWRSDGVREKRRSNLPTQGAMRRTYLRHICRRPSSFEYRPPAKGIDESSDPSK